VLSEPRTISLLCELIHLPMKHPLAALREVYNKVCNVCGYENFIRTSGGVRLERHDPESDGFSHLNFNADRIQFTDDHMGVSVLQFAAKVQAVLQEAIPLLRIPVILVQQATVRVVTTPNSSKSAADFLGRNIFRIRGDDIAVLARPTSVFGFRLLFPSTTKNPNSFNARIEAYLRDPRSLYVENVGTFKAPIQLPSLEIVGQNMQETSNYLVNHILPFLSRFDKLETEL
jgi:hypothetical protein